MAGRRRRGSTTRRASLHEQGRIARAMAQREWDLRVAYPHLAPTARLIVTVIEQRTLLAHGDGRLRVRTIAAQANCSERTVYRHMATLETLGILEISPCGAANGATRANQYRVRRPARQDDEARLARRQGRAERDAARKAGRLVAGRRPGDPWRKLPEPHEGGGLTLVSRRQPLRTRARVEPPYGEGRYTLPAGPPGRDGPTGGPSRPAGDADDQPLDPETAAALLRAWLDRQPGGGGDRP